MDLTQCTQHATGRWASFPFTMESRAERADIAREHAVRRLAAAIGIATAVAGCGVWPFSNGSTSGAVGRDTTIVVSSPSGLVQRLYLSSNPVASGDSLQIVATIVNHSTGPVRAWAGYGCRLDMMTTLLQFAGAECLVASAPVSLAPGDSVTGSAHEVVASPPGNYSLSVRQAVDSALTATVIVMVVKR
jgi:hypothetical protein